MKSIQQKLHIYKKTNSMKSFFLHSLRKITTGICFFIIAIITCISLYFKIILTNLCVTWLNGKYINQNLKFPKC